MKFYVCRIWKKTAEGWTPIACKQFVTEEGAEAYGRFVVRIEDAGTRAYDVYVKEAH